MTENSNSANSNFDLNQLKIKSSALRSSFPLIFTLLCLGGAGGGVLLQIAYENSDRPTIQRSIRPKITQPSSVVLGNRRSKPAFDRPPVGRAESVQFGNLDYPVTNTICTRTGNFCIYNLADLIQETKDEAYYIFSENDPQKGLLTINGYIKILEIEKQGNTKLFTFRWQDDQRTTTDGYAAMGTFRLENDPDPSKKGILAKFKTTKSFGVKTPVGLENTSYLFPQ